MAAAESERVCVTGAGGFVASWLVKHLLSKGYLVHGTIREPGNHKYAHLEKLEKASEKLKLFKADVLNYDSLYSAIEGCSGVFHVASPAPAGPVSNPEVELFEPAVKGTLNVLKACVEAKVKRVVVVSSISAVVLNPKWPKEKVMDESCWSDTEYCRNTQNWYYVSKTEAEWEALEFAKTNGIDVVTVCPALVFGPLLQSTVNASSFGLAMLMKGFQSTMENKNLDIVDVRDLADALLLVYEKREAEGRYICLAHSVKTQEMVDKLRTLYPNYGYPSKIVDVEEDTRLSSDKLHKLGWTTFRPLEETFTDSVESYRKAGVLETN
ncbi:Cinnamoyl-CoA reductase [Quillaja saponaria]|uniref:Cinnamoyl-CoA reductase n=1 Tax=Quillaja saponaria TaxID=32244 RepID=A0AAD7LHG9_QUISA|nr:Cinnamoyl-CoA reductase [Quillaja saponaria]WLD47575.1 KR1 [Quillaja saponaria]